jgi:hypothetical protein
MIVTMGSIRGSPGVTSWSLLLAAAWPASFDVERVVVEADIDGGVLGARYGFGVDPGVVSLIAALRRSDDRAVAVDEHARLVGDGLWVLPGPESGEQARAVWTGTADSVAARLAEDERVWLVDAGRLDAASPVLPLAQLARLSIVVCGGGHEDLVQVPARVATLAGHAESVGVMVVGKTSHTTGELAGFFDTVLVWQVGASDDLDGLAGAALAGGRGRRSWLWRTALDVAARVADVAHTDPDAVGSVIDRERMS